uniref:ACYPI009752 protein n=1 Tax=Acyrthosiphon pisum TaxID=7029 RepID=C4WSV8_ACYPI|nr:ACYPI009752 [Acyrthosiphon pisum]
MVLLKTTVVVLLAVACVSAATSTPVKSPLAADVHQEKPDVSFPPEPMKPTTSGSNISTTVPTIDNKTTTVVPPTSKPTTTSIPTTTTATTTTTAPPTTQAPNVTTTTIKPSTTTLAPNGTTTTLSPNSTTAVHPLLQNHLQHHLRLEVGMVQVS